MERTLSTSLAPDRGGNLKRRHFLALTTGLLAAPAFAVSTARETPLFLSAASDADDRHWVIGFRQSNGQVSQVFKHALPSRAHYIAIHEGLGIYVVLARRPGRYLWVGDIDTGARLAEITVPMDRHLYGHGVFTTAGDRFYTSENAWQFINGDSGRIVAWDVVRDGDSITMTRSLEFPSYGVGPHELLLKQQAGVLVIANGGIRTSPEQPRAKLNIDSMQPSLAYIDAGNGQLLEQHTLDSDWHKASIRHIDLNAAGQVVMGMQYEGEPFERAPLIATHTQGQPLTPLWAPEPQQGQMSQYVGSIRYDASGDYFAATCPRGNLITLWHARSGGMVRSLRSRDGCGICAVENGFLYTAGTGRISHYDPLHDAVTELDSAATGSVFWDNHLSTRRA